jgi:hypothetical protein
MTIPTIPHSATVVVASDVVASEFGDELVVLNLRDGVYYGLEDVGARIWKLMQNPVSVTAIREALLAEYDVEPARCEQAICTLLAQLVDKGLVAIQEGA